MDSHLLDLSYAIQPRKKSILRQILKAVAICLWFALEMTIGLILTPFVLPFVSKEERKQLGC